MSVQRIASFLWKWKLCGAGRLQSVPHSIVVNPFWHTLTRSLTSTELPHTASRQETPPPPIAQRHHRAQQLYSRRGNNQMRRSICTPSQGLCFSPRRSRVGKLSGFEFPSYFPQFAVMWHERSNSRAQRRYYAMLVMQTHPTIRPNGNNTSQSHSLVLVH